MAIDTYQINQTVPCFGYTYDLALPHNYNNYGMLSVLPTSQYVYYVNCHLSPRASVTMKPLPRCITIRPQASAAEVLTDTSVMYLHDAIDAGDAPGHRSSSVVAMDDDNFKHESRLNRGWHPFLGSHMTVYINTGIITLPRSLVKGFSFLQCLGGWGVLGGSGYYPKLENPT